MNSMHPIMSVIIATLLCSFASAQDKGNWIKNVTYDDTFFGVTAEIETDAVYKTSRTPNPFDIDDPATIHTRLIVDSVVIDEATDQVLNTPKLGELSGQFSKSYSFLAPSAWPIVLEEEVVENTKTTVNDFFLVTVPLEEGVWLDRFEQQAFGIGRFYQIRTGYENSSGETRRLSLSWRYPGDARWFDYELADVPAFSSGCRYFELPFGNFDIEIRVEMLDENLDVVDKWSHLIEVPID